MTDGDETAMTETKEVVDDLPPHLRDDIAGAFP
jgi:hypothetical protein